MPPPFLLEPIRHDSNSHCAKNILHAKNLYSTGVKFEGWQDFRGAEPVDRDPVAGDARNLHLSHYDRLGGYPDERWTTTTRESLDRTQSLRREFEDRPQKSLLNFYTPLPCDEPEERNSEVCSSPYGYDYLTTMQHSYQPLYPYVMQRISLPVTPFYENRRLVTRAGCKFQDDDYVNQVKTLQKYKIHRDVSFNPCTCLYTDGSTGEVPRPGCVKLDY